MDSPLFTNNGANEIVGTVFIDLLFALLPWNFVWKLNMSRKDKLVIAGSLSLGLLWVLILLCWLISLELILIRAHI